MFISHMIARFYRSGIAPRIAAQMSGLAYRDVIRQYNVLADHRDGQEGINARDLRKIAADQVKVQTQEVCVSRTTDVYQGKSDCAMASAYFIERKIERRNRVKFVSPTICTLPVILDLMHKDSLASAIAP
jgi:hypothetical protein